MTVNNTTLESSTTTAGGLRAAPTKLLYNKTEAAEMLSLSVRTIENLIANRELIVRRVGRRVLIPHHALMQFTRRDFRTERVQ
jgi:excisionase family DNA binding protein